MPVIPAPAAPTHTLGTTRFTSLATPSRGTTDTAVWQVEMEPGTPAVPHSLTREEVFVVLAGTASARIGDRVELARPGDAIVVPAGVPFALENGGDELAPARLLPAGGRPGVPGGRQRVHPAVGRVTTPASPPLARLFAIAYRSLDRRPARRAAAAEVARRAALRSGSCCSPSSDAPTTVTALAALMGTSKQAASKLVDTMEDAGYVRRVAGADRQPAAAGAADARGAGGCSPRSRRSTPSSRPGGRR